MSKSNDVLHLENQLCFALYTASRFIIQKYRPLLSSLGITYPQYLVFLVLWDTDNITLKMIGEKLFLDSGTLTPLLKRLEIQGFLTRERRSENEREIRICLTDKGRKLRTKAIAIPPKMLCASKLPPIEAKNLKKNVMKLIDNFRE